jgi:hypothetical protein
MTTLDMLRAEHEIAVNNMLADAERWAELACGQNTEETEYSGWLAGYADGLWAAIKIVSEARDLIPLADIVAAIGADDTDDDGIINACASDQLAGLYALLNSYGNVVA